MPAGPAPCQAISPAAGRASSADSIGKAGHGPDRREFPHEAIGGERQGYQQADPQAVERAPDQDGDAGGGERDRAPLRPAQPFLQEQRADQDAHQRRYVVAEAGRQNVSLLHGGDVDQPVRADEQRAQHQQAKHARRAQGEAQVRELSAQADDGQADGQSEQHAPADEFERRHIAHEPEIER